MTSKSLALGCSNGSLSPCIFYLIFWTVVAISSPLSTAFQSKCPTTTTTTFQSQSTIQRQKRSRTVQQNKLCGGDVDSSSSSSFSRTERDCHDKYQARNFLPVNPQNIWEQMALSLVNVNENGHVKDYVQAITLLRVCVPSFGLAAIAKFLYPTAGMTLANIIDDAGVFAVVSQDASQYIQNILTTSGLVFGLLVGQTYYFMYQQQESIFLALFEEVTMAKSLLEQVALVCQGRDRLYKNILDCIDRYVREDLTRFNDQEPAILISARPIDDPLEDILYLTSVGEPSIVYQTVRSLRQARAYRLGALQLKLPDLHMTLLWVLFGIVLFTFPLLGAGSQTIGGMGILIVQSWYLGFIVFGMALALRIIYELRDPSRVGAYNAQVVLNVMVAGLQEDLEWRLKKQNEGSDDNLMMMMDNDTMAGDWDQFYEPSIDADGFREKNISGD